MGLLDLPEKVDAWTFDTVVTIVRKYEFEPGQFDYKGILVSLRTDPTKDEYNASIRRTVCSMANADGGFILFGIRDRGQAVSSPDDRIVGIPLGGDLRKQFSEKISPIQRPVHFDASPEPIVLPTDSKRGIFIVQIPQSQLRPHMDMFTGAFYRRGEGGKADKMSFYEVRDQMLYTEGRLQKVRLLRLKIAQFKMLREMQLKSGYQWEEELVKYLQYETSGFETLIADTCDLIPSRTNLLQKLLDLSRTAEIINTVRNRNNNFTGNNRENIFAQESNLLASLCENCEKQLAEIFGPLTKTEV